MSDGTQPLATGSYVQYNVTTQSPQSMLPSAAEQTIGIVRQLFTAQGTQYAQVVWNPGSQTPATGLYTADQLCAITQQQAADLTNQMNAGTYQPPTELQVLITSNLLFLLWLYRQLFKDSR